MIRCKTCGEGELSKRKRYRMSGVVVFIGYILLIPSFLAMLFSAVLLFTTAFAADSVMDIAKSKAETTLSDAGIPDLITEKVIELEPVPKDDLDKLPPEQRQVVDQVTEALSLNDSANKIGGVFVGGFAFFVIVSSLVGGLLGWLLIMKKKVLQCSNCEAITAIS